MNLTRIVKGKLSLNLESADVHRLIGAVTEMYQSEIQAKRIQLSVQLQAQNHYTCGDPARLQQVFWNIIKNATKFTPESGRIDIATRDGSDERIEISFHDSGIGISPEVKARLFTAFEQGSVEMVKRYGWLGLGLASARRCWTHKAETSRPRVTGRGTVRLSLSRCPR